MIASALVSGLSGFGLALLGMAACVVIVCAVFYLFRNF